MNPKQWAQIWKNNEAALDAVRVADIRASVPAQAIRNFDSAFRFAIQNNQPRPTSGLIEMKRLLGKLPSC